LLLVFLLENGANAEITDVEGPCTVDLVAGESAGEIQSLLSSSNE